MLYFWRTYEQEEVDLIEEYDGAMHGFEFKWSGSAAMPKEFSENYANSSFQAINKENYFDFLEK